MRINSPVTTMRGVAPYVETSIVNSPAGLVKGSRSFSMTHLPYQRLAIRSRAVGPGPRLQSAPPARQKLAWQGKALGERGESLAWIRLDMGLTLTRSTSVRSRVLLVPAFFRI